MNLVKVIIPVYRSNLHPMEKASILQALRVLGSHPIVILYPEGMQKPDIQTGSMVEWLSVSDEWLGTRNGIAGYNKMMLSYDFYQLFRDSEYVLIYQTDAWVFQDNLAEWCSKGYDYVAAPWIKRAVYDYPFIKQYMACLRAYRARKHQFCRQRIYGRVGNGGLSLRKVSSFSEACLLYKCEIGKYLSHRKHYYNEDVFWATEPRFFRYPTENEALGFSFDRYPDICFKRTGGTLPFGCHSWSKPGMYKFWKHIISWEKLIS